VKQVLGYEPDEFVYLKQIDITHADDKPIVMAALAYYYSHVGRVRYEPFSAAIHFQHRVIHKSGEVRSIMRSSIPIAYGLDDKMTYHVSIATDITEMKPSNRVRIWQDGLSDDIKPFPTETFYENQSLTKREMDILFYVCQGFTSADIAMRLHISRHTVDTHRRRILSKLHLQNTTQLIKAAHENEWFPTRSEPTKRDPDAANEMESGSDDGFGSGIDPNMRG
jgi:DNA-binding CsgD family transcriptional regulator